MPSEHPTWDDDICKLFAAPYWIDEERRTEVAAGWSGCMAGYFVELDKYASVRDWAVTIYNHLHSQNMPATSDSSQLFPAEALEAFRKWVNEGSRKSSTDPIDEHTIIPRPSPPHVNFRVRMDLRKMKGDQLNIYRAKLDDIMCIGDPSPGSRWQQLAYLHTNWCLHYQEAFVFWHRAYLMHFEALIDHPIPYWNWMAEEASVDGKPDAGLPQAFKDETYIHPTTGVVRLNPLRYAAAKDGRNKTCRTSHPASCAAPECKYVARDPLLYTTGDHDKEEREKKIRMTKIFQGQVSNALQWSVFSTPQGQYGPWANIPTFNPPQVDDLYPHRTDFDGLYEQPHDNYHGWIGGDMADNAFTAFDPIFWSYHSNIDRMYEVWREKFPDSMYTTATPLRPFLGATAKSIDHVDPRKWRFTTPGDLAQDTRRLGFEYGKPHSQEYRDVEASGDFPPGRYSASDNDHLWAVFQGVRCTFESYSIDVFLNLKDPQAEDVDPDKPNYVGRLSRIGMGIEDDKGRCVKDGVTRVLDASKNVRRLGIYPGTKVELTTLVRDLETGAVLGATECQSLPGFVPQPYWGGPWPIGMELARPACLSETCDD